MDTDAVKREMRIKLIDRRSHFRRQEKFLVDLVLECRLDDSNTVYSEPPVCNTCLQLQVMIPQWNMIHLWMESRFWKTLVLLLCQVP